jgi:DNA repair protein RadA/Sms
VHSLNEIHNICQNCGNESPKWLGKCPECDAWNTMIEELDIPDNNQNVIVELQNNNIPVKITKIQNHDQKRMKSGNKELDRVLGGGLVYGSVVLIGGDPGIGKSTILLQMAQTIGNQDKKVLYVSGEESNIQIKMRSERLGIDTENLYIYGEINIHNILLAIKTEKPDIVMVDSIQTMYNHLLASTPGTVSQIREITNTLIQIAKKNNIIMIIIGHVTKQGAIAGPKVLEHMVDTVLYFEGEKYNTYRILRSVKNRYGSTNEIGIFEMGERGLKEVINPSQMLLDNRPEKATGTIVAPCIEGSRSILVEIQGLVSMSAFGTPRRMATGVDYNRMVLVIAILEKQLGIQMHNLDIYLNVVGGIKIDEPGIDLGMAIAIFSSFRNIIVNPKMVAFGEIGLSGEIRSVGKTDKRLIEAQKLGFSDCLIPDTKDLHLDNITMNIHFVKNIGDVLEYLKTQ